MPNPIVPRVLLLTEGTSSETSTPASSASPPTPRSESRFAEVLGDAARRLDAGRREIDAVIAGARRGDLPPEQLLAIQAGVYRYTQEVELASKVVDRVTNGVKTVLQSQQ
jgi:hypothetical protein